MKELPPERWRAVRELFEAALALPEGERAALLERSAAEDAELHEEVLALLASHRRAGGFLEPAAARLLDPTATGTPVPEAGERLGPYRLLREIGRGGMGTVYLAVRADGAYSMRVAVKVLSAGLDSDRARRRFHGERQMLADLDHPAIARLLDGGTTADGRPYLVMELVEGEPIDRYCERRRLPIRARIELFARVCEAVHYAHQSLIVHRDLKPSHIVVQADGEPKLLDFGIAKLLTGRGEAEGSFTGPPSRPLTPRYASPEQLRGGRITPASDVYSLGVVLYELLSGSPPYRLGGDLEAMIETICETSPPPPSAARWPGSANGSDADAEDSRRAAAAARSASPRSLRRQLGGDLDAITLKALAKEPQLRLSTAGELAAELDRHRRGEPVLSRAPSVAYRWRRRLGRNKAMTAAAAIVLISVLAAGGLAQRQRAAARRQVELVHEFGQEGQELAMLMRQAAMLPSHDIRPQRQRVRERMEAIRQRSHDLGPVAAAPASYALGLGHLALDEFEAARRELENAWAGGLETPAVAYGLGEAYARLYRRGQFLAPASPDGVYRPGDAAFRAEALAMLERSHGAETASPHYIAALIAFAEKDYAAALAEARRATAGHPWRYRAHHLAAEALVELALRSASQGDYERAFQHFEAGRKTLARATELARSDPTGWVLACGLELRRSQVGAETGERSREAVQRGLSHCDRALAIDPDSVEAKVTKANLWTQIADDDAMQGKDPTPALETGLEIAREVGDRYPDEGLAQDAVGRLHYALARWMMTHGSDPTEHLRAAEEALVRATELLPRSVAAANSLGLVYQRQWLWESDRARGEAAFDRAVGGHREALRRGPSDPTAISQLAMLFGRRALAELDESGDPEPYLGSAIDHLEEAARLNPRDPFTLTYLGNCYLARAMRATDAGEDPEPDLRSSAAWFQSALAANPEFSHTSHNLGILERVRAGAEVDRGTDPSAAIAAGREWFSDLPEDASVAHELGELALAEARWRASRGDDAADAFAATRRYLNRSVELNPQDPRIYVVRARAALAEARWRASHGDGASAVILRGLADTARARDRKQGMARADAVEGSLLRLQAAAEPSAERRADLATAAIARLENALGTNPLLEHRYGPELEKARGLAAARDGD